MVYAEVQMYHMKTATCCSPLMAQKSGQQHRNSSVSRRCHIPGLSMTVYGILSTRRRAGGTDVSLLKDSQNVINAWISY